MKRIACLLLSVALLVSLIGCSSPAPAPKAPEEKIVIKVGSVVSPASPGAQSLEVFKKTVAEKTNGRIDVQLFLSGQLGKELEMIDQVRLGDIQMATSNPMNISNTIKPLAALESYFLLDDLEHAFRFQDSAAGLAMLDEYKAMGMQGVAYFPTGFRQFTNSKQPINAVSDLKGLKIRGYSEVQTKAWESVGASLSAVAWGELFTSLQQKLIDGQESAISSIYEAKFYEVQKYLSLTSHLFSTDILVANEKFMNSLSDADRQIITDALKDAVAAHRVTLVQGNDEYLQKIKDAGVEVNEVPLEVRQEMGTIMNKVVGPTIISLAGQEKYDFVQKAAQDTRK